MRSSPRLRGQAHSLHLQKLETMKPSIDMKSPQPYARLTLRRSNGRLTLCGAGSLLRVCRRDDGDRRYPHVQINAKRQQMEAERNSAIERENKVMILSLSRLRRAHATPCKPNRVRAC